MSEEKFISAILSQCARVHGVTATMDMHGTRKVLVIKLHYIGSMASVDQRERNHELITKQLIKYLPIGMGLEVRQ